jgi:hypothetical protein
LASALVSYSVNGRPVRLDLQLGLLRFMLSGNFLQRRWQTVEKAPDFSGAF